ncbi:MAG TPA: FecR domain-containing protein [Candidatus Deferrimicrobium sp.]|nr:FecR domain-containing protein [Candidatus Deferrimicrobium sp.]
MDLLHCVTGADDPDRETNRVMGKLMTYYYRALPILLGLIFAAASSAAADIGQIKNVSGAVFILRQNVQQPAKAGDLVQQSDVLITGANGAVGLTFIDSSRLSAGPNSRIELKQFRFNPTTHDGEFVTDVQRGTLAVVSGQIANRSPDAMKVKTPTTILGVRGTTFAVQVEE